MADSEKYSRNACFQPTTVARCANSRSASAIASRADGIGSGLPAPRWATAGAPAASAKTQATPRRRMPDARSAMLGIYAGSRRRLSAPDDFEGTAGRTLGRIAGNRAAVDDLDRLVDDHLVPRAGTRAGLQPDLLHVVACLAVGRHVAAVAVHGTGAGVVRRERELLVALVAVEQLAQVRRAAADVFFRVVGIADAELARRGGHQLHEPHRAFRRGGCRVVAGLDLDDGAHQLGPQRVPLR